MNGKGWWLHQQTLGSAAWIQTCLCCLPPCIPDALASSSATWDNNSTNLVRLLWVECKVPRAVPGTHGKSATLVSFYYYFFWRMHSIFTPLFLMRPVLFFFFLNETSFFFFFWLWKLTGVESYRLIRWRLVFGGWSILITVIGHAIIFLFWEVGGFFSCGVLCTSVSQCCWY